jgi:hypothetical protein
MHLYPINGTCHRVGADETAFAYRDATFATVIVAAWQDPAVGAERIAWVRDYYQATAHTRRPAATSTSWPTMTRATSTSKSTPTDESSFDR